MRKDPDESPLDCAGSPGWCCDCSFIQRRCHGNESLGARGECKAWKMHPNTKRKETRHVVGVYKEPTMNKNKPRKRMVK